jgi:hypothetical protein
VVRDLRVAGQRDRMELGDVLLDRVDVRLDREDARPVA